MALCIFPLISASGMPFPLTNFYYVLVDDTGNILRIAETAEHCNYFSVLFLEHTFFSCLIQFFLCSLPLLFIFRQSTKLLNILKEKAKNLRGYHEDTGEMNQEAFFKFSDYVSSSIPPVKLLRNMQIAADYLASKGIGMIHSVSGVGYTMDLDVDMENWFAKGLDNGL